jgi:hypothetical protein
MRTCPKNPLAIAREKIAALGATELQNTKPSRHDISDAFTAIGELNRRTARSSPTRPPKGAKTIARITKIDEILKGRGPTTLKELEMFLNIRPQEMGRIIARLDRRRYEILFRDGNKRDKVLRLKVQIR